MTEKGNGKVGEQVAPAPSENQMKVGPQQIQAAAAAGAELLADKDLRVPLGNAGPLNLLQGLLGAVVRGELLMVGAEEAAKLKAAAPIPDAPDTGDSAEEPTK